MSKIAKSKPRKATSAAQRAKRVPTPRKNKPSQATAPSSTRENSKLANMIALLRRKEGATLEQMMKATDWQSHSVRGAMSGALKKKRGLDITSSKEGPVRVYRIVDASSASRQ
jgi:hypothetical protein